MNRMGMRRVGRLGTQQPSRRQESEALTAAARQLSLLGCDSTQISHLFGNVTALFALKAGLSRRDYIELCLAVWAATEHQLAGLEAPLSAPGGEA